MLGVKLWSPSRASRMRFKPPLPDSNGWLLRMGQRSDGKKQPFLIEPFDGQVKFMAKLWEENRKVVDGSGIRSCTVITTAANSMTAKVHERMPAFICDAEIGVWLDPECHDVALLKNFLRPAKEKAFKLTAVSPHVNSPRNEDERCTEPVDTKSVWETE